MCGARSDANSDSIQPLFVALTDCNIYGLARAVGCQHASALIGYRRASDNQILVDLIEGNMTWKGRGDDRQHAHPTSPDAAVGPKGSYFVDASKLEPFVVDVTEAWLARERGLCCHPAAVPSWWETDRSGEKRATWTRWNSISTGQVPFSSATDAERAKHRYISSFDETVMWFEDLRQLSFEDVRSAVTAAIVTYEDRQGLTIAPPCLKGKLAGLAPLDEWAGLVTHGVRVTSDLVQTSDPNMNCYGFASYLIMQLRAAKAQLAGTDDEFRSYLQEPIWRLNGYESLEEVKWSEALFARNCCSAYRALSERTNLVFAPEWPGQTWANHSLIENFLRTDPHQLRLDTLQDWHARDCGQQGKTMEIIACALSG